MRANREENDTLHGPYWLRAHQDWRFWAVVLAMLAAMLTYVLTGNLAYRPVVKTGISTGK